MRDIAQALVSLRQELKQDISESVAREMTALRSEIRSIKSIAEDQNFTEDLRGDLARLAEGISQARISGDAGGRRPAQRIRGTAGCHGRPRPRGFRTAHGIPLGRARRPHARSRLGSASRRASSRSPTASTISRASSAR
uniref:hypothetical protein n=1 Tax=Neorhizobium sp. EC2-8 TaxID=3129230 RepID=UPI003101531D